MKTLTAIEAQIQIIESVQRFQELMKAGKQGMTANISNVDFTEIIALYKCLKTPDKMLVVPGEYGEDEFKVIYWPSDNCRIVITSTPAKHFRPRINTINYN